ncbi:MAG: fructosamine kinase family protein [Cytophagales bacterium]|nr:fructosamine kinase family protein [Cytophagales bacterium]
MYHDFFTGVLEQSLGRRIPISRSLALGGGSINKAYKLETAEGDFFLKFNSGEKLDMFFREKEGLELLKEKGFGCIPRLHGMGLEGSRSYLLMEYWKPARRQADYWERLGEELARLHRNTQDCFGLDQDNYIGSLPQTNNPLQNGFDFLVTNRLEVQVKRAYDQNYLSKAHVSSFEQLYGMLPGLLPDEPPALLHGDLWSGNVITSPSGEAGLIDPAVYYGFREMDLAFSKLFGGFSDSFYEAYQSRFPLEPDFSDRLDLYNLYPLLVHLNLFGLGYQSDVLRIIKHFTHKQ